MAWRVLFHSVNTTYQLKQFPNGSLGWYPASVGYASTVDTRFDTEEEAKTLLARAKAENVTPPNAWEAVKNYGDAFRGVYIEEWSV